MTIRKYEENDIGGMIAVWNEIVEAGDAFPQEEPLTPQAGAEFFDAQTYTGVAVDEQGTVLGLYIFNAVVEGNVHARHLYERLGFTQLGMIPRGFQMNDGSFANICPYFKEIV